MRIASVAAAAACLGMFIAGMGTSYAGGINKTVKTSAIPSVTRTTGYPKPDLALPGGSQYTILIQSYAKQYGVPVDLAHAVVQVESNFNPKARGRAGEVGLMQIKPATARMMGYSGSVKELYDPETNIKFGMKYLAKAKELSDGSTCGTILKYNAGHGAKRMNPVSKRYCGKVKTILDWL
ncbi:transglycosylase SLT domain-containing protein [Sinorhizobium medicae]|nr:transglycosylase SLT domain-containing protein [Sinorhizobium medicae]